MKAIYARYTNPVESFSICECWMDGTDSSSIRGNEERFANASRETVRSETGLTISVGVSWNKILAKLGSDFKKTDATTIIIRDSFKKKVWPLPASDLLFVGHVTNDKRSGKGVHATGDRATSSPEFYSKF